MKRYALYFDGSCEPFNPGGRAAYGFLLINDKDKTEIERGHGVVGEGAEMSSNVAEYAALIFGFDAFMRHENEPNCWLDVRGDSKMVIEQMSGRWGANRGLYFPYFQQAWKMLRQLQDHAIMVQFEWIPRVANEICDELSKADQPVVRSRDFPRTEEDLISLGYESSGIGLCSWCGVEIQWWTMPTGTKLPTDVGTGLSHRESCVNGNGGKPRKKKNKKHYGY